MHSALLHVQIGHGRGFKSHDMCTRGAAAVLTAHTVLLHMQSYVSHT